MSDENKSSGLIPVGNYIARGIHAALIESEDGKPSVVAAVVIAHGPFTGRRLTWFGSLAEVAKEAGKKAPCDRTFEALAALGWRGDILDLALSGVQEVLVVITHEEYQGKPQARVAFINRLLPGKMLGADKAAALAAKFAQRPVLIS